MLGFAVICQKGVNLPFVVTVDKITSNCIIALSTRGAPKRFIRLSSCKFAVYPTHDLAQNQCRRILEICGIDKVSTASKSLKIAEHEFKRNLVRYFDA